MHQGEDRNRKGTKLSFNLQSNHKVSYWSFARLWSKAPTRLLSQLCLVRAITTHNLPTFTVLLYTYLLLASYSSLPSTYLIQTAVELLAFGARPVAREFWEIWKGCKVRKENTGLIRHESLTRGMLLLDTMV